MNENAANISTGRIGILACSWWTDKNVRPTGDSVGATRWVARGMKER